MNKYQKQINKITRHYINGEKRAFHENILKNLTFDNKQSAKYSVLDVLKYSQKLYSSGYYQKIRKKIRKQMEIVKNPTHLEFEKEYKCIWIK